MVSGLQLYLHGWTFEKRGGPCRKRKEASVNGHCVMSERIRHHHLDDLVAVMTHIKLYDHCMHVGRGLGCNSLSCCRSMDVIPVLWKFDVDAAFRRVPLAPQDWWAAFAVFIVQGTVLWACFFSVSWSCYMFVLTVR